VSIEILIPYYGRFDYLRQAVESILAQTDSNWELTVVDDGYPSTEAADYFSELADPRIAYLRNNSNLGITANFNSCLKLAKREHFVLMGFDDRLGPSFIAEANNLVAALPDAAIYQLGVEVIDSVGKVYQPLPDKIKSILRPSSSEPKALTGDSALASLMLGNWLYFPSLIWKSVKIKQHVFDSRFEIVQDLDLISKMLLEGGEMALSDNVCFQYRRHAASESSRAGGNAKRYREERVLFSELKLALRSRGLNKAALRAELRITSRLAALVDAGKLLVSGKILHVAPLMKVAFGR